MPPAIASDASTLAREFDLRHLNPAFHADPYPVYHALRAHEPVKRMPDGSLFLTRFRDVQAVYRDPKTFSSDKTVEFKPKYGDSPLYTHHTTSLVFSDPPRHTRVRKLIAGALTARAIAAMEPGLIRLVDGLLDAAAVRGRIDLIGEFASAIPVEIIGNLLDVPHAEREPLRDWSLAILGALEPSLNEAQLERGNRAVSEFVEYLRDLVGQRRREPGDPQHDVLTRLIQGEQGGQGGEQLSEAELLQNCIFILNAGHETTTNLIGNGLVTLTDWPEQRAALLREPSLIESAVEECLRYESSNQLGNRMADRRHRDRRRRDRARHACHTVHRRGQSRPRAVRATGPLRHPPRAEPASRVRLRHSSVRGAVARAARSAYRDRSLRAARFPAYRLDGEPTRGGRVRFRGFAAVPVELELRRAAAEAG